QPLEKNAGEEVGFLLAPGTGLQHGRHQLRRLAGAQGGHLEKPLRLLEIRQLVRSDEPLLDVVVGSLRRLAFHNVGNQANGLVREGGDHVTVAVK
ncbi:MAG: hypothetical protein ACK56I_19250, partial [bacterium]